MEKEKEDKIPAIPVKIIDKQLAKVYANSIKGMVSFSNICLNPQYLLFRVFCRMNFETIQICFARRYPSLGKCRIL